MESNIHLSKKFTAKKGKPSHGREKESPCKKMLTEIGTKISNLFCKANVEPKSATKGKHFTGKREFVNFKNGKRSRAEFVANHKNKSLSLKS